MLRYLTRSKIELCQTSDHSFGRAKERTIPSDFGLNGAALTVLGDSPVAFALFRLPLEGRTAGVKLGESTLSLLLALHSGHLISIVRRAGGTNQLFGLCWRSSSLGGIMIEGAACKRPSVRVNKMFASRHDSDLCLHTDSARILSHSDKVSLGCSLLSTEPVKARLFACVFTGFSPRPLGRGDEAGRRSGVPGVIVAMVRPAGCRQGGILSDFGVSLN